MAARGGGPVVSPWLLAILIAGHFSAFVDRSLPSAMAPQIKAAFRLNDSRLGELQGPAFIALYTLAALSAVWIVDRWRRPVMVASVLIWTAGSLVLATAGDFRTLLAGRLITGLGQALFAPCALAVIAEGTPASARGRRISAFTAGSAVGRSAAFLLAGFAVLAVAGVASAWRIPPWRLAFLVLIAPNVALATALGLLREAALPSQPRPRTVAGYRAAFGWVRQRPAATLGVTLCAACGVTSIQTISAWGPSLLHRSFSISAAAASVSFGAALIPAALAGHLGGGWLADAMRRAGRTPLEPLAAGLVLAAAGTAAAPLMPGPMLATATLALAALGASTAALSGLIAMQTISPSDRRGSLGALFLAVTSLLGFGVGPLTAGWLSDRGGGSGVALSHALTLLLCAAAAIGLAAVVLLRGRWRRAAAAAGDLDT